jgi:hypothetical protein
VQQLVEQERLKGREAGEQQRRGVLLERHSGSRPAMTPSVQSAQSLATDFTPPATSATVLSSAMTPANCTVKLAAADRQQLQREVSGILRSLADIHPWVTGLPDVQLDGSAQQHEQAPSSVSRGQQLPVLGTQVPRVVDERHGRQSSANVPGDAASHGLRLPCNRACCCLIAAGSRLSLL